MKRKWIDKIRKITPYTPGEQPKFKNIIKLNTNELPFAPSPGIKGLFNEYDTDNLRLYPSFTCDTLKASLSKTYNLPCEQIFVGNGSDEVIALCFQTFFNAGVCFADITYSFYDVWCDLYNIEYKKIPLDSGFNITKEDYYGAGTGIVIANPNAPTGICLGIDEIECILKANEDVIVLIDEAYIDFGGESAVSLIPKYDNLVVVQTFSKSRALAGIRVGYAMANPELIAFLDAVKNSFNSYTLSTITQDIAVAALEDRAYFNECADKIVTVREKTVDELDKLSFNTLPSKANFIFTTHPGIRAKELFEFLKRNGILVRYFEKERINEYLRITIGTDPQMEKLIQAIKGYIND